jgi:hypothetical protein
MANNQQLLLGEGAGSAPAVYIEDVFSTYLYDGTGATQTITNNIDLSTKGGLVWIKNRATTSGFTFNHVLFDTTRGALNRLITNNTDSSQGTTGTLTSFNTNGFSLGADSGGNVNYGTGTNTYASWTFREQPKFFDIVTYTGTGSNTTIAHTLGAVPGCIIVKRTDTTADWAVYHRSLANTEYLVLNTTAAKATGATWWNSTTPTSSVFSVGTDASVNASGGTYVAYIYAHDAGGFGLAGTDNVISCGSFTASGAGAATVNLGYEPQWVLMKPSNSTGGAWILFDNMRGWNLSVNDEYLIANTAGAAASYDYGEPTATGFNLTNGAGGLDYIYIAIRRGPMKVPTVGTSVYNGIVRTGTSATATISGAGFPPDFALTKHKDGAGNSYSLTDRLRGAGSSTSVLNTNNTNAEQSGTTDVTSFTMDGAVVGTNGTVNYTGYSYINWFFKRAPGFFDEVCYTGTNPAQTLSHNLAAVPELIIVKRRLYADNWPVYSAALGNQTRLILNLTDAQYAPPTSVFWDSTTPTATTFTVGTYSEMNGAGNTFVAYLFATLAKVSKVGSYTGNGSSQTIACGFTAGSRFVMIKRTDSTGDWYVWDSARGIVAGNDPHLSLNTTAAEVTTDDSVDTDNSGFIVNQLSATNVNVSSASYIFLAVS